MNDVDQNLEEHAFLVKKRINEFSDGYFNFVSNPYVLYGDIEEDKIKKTFCEILYTIQEKAIREAVDIEQ